MLKIILTSQLELKKANYWIDEYIIPLNIILNKDHPNSVIQEMNNRPIPDKPVWLSFLKQLKQE